MRTVAFPPFFPAVALNGFPLHGAPDAGALFHMVSGACSPRAWDAGQPPEFAGYTGPHKGVYGLNLIHCRREENGLCLLCPLANSGFFITNAQKERKLNHNPYWPLPDPEH